MFSRKQTRSCTCDLMQLSHQSKKVSCLYLQLLSVLTNATLTCIAQQTDKNIKK